jgi:eukaryotic-like serine/threonine-protein kinase
VTIANRELGRYRVGARVGSGGMAVVYRGRDERLGRPVAIKVLADNLAADDGFRERFVREARLAAGLSHPNIVHVYDTGEDADGRPYIVMEYIDGESLAATVQREDRLSPQRVAEIALDCCAGLEYAHAAGLVHRDVKPHNLLVDRRGTVRIADFGVARSLDSATITRTGSVLGTTAYQAPEQARGEQVTTAADIYGLGATLYQLLTGQTPGVRRRVATLSPDVPAHLRDAVMWCLASDPAGRPTAGALAAALRRPPDGVTRVLTPPGDDDRTRVIRSHGGRLPLPGVRRAVAVLSVMLVILTAAVVVDSLGGGAPAPRHHHRTRVSGPAPGATPAMSARHLADWIRAHSG